MLQSEQLHNSFSKHLQLLQYKDGCYTNKRGSTQHKDKENETKVTGYLTCMVMSKLEGCPSSPLMNISLEASTKKTKLSLPVIL